MAIKTHTINKITSQVEMVSDGANQYDNPNWYDLQLDDAVFEEWKNLGRAAQLMYNESEGTLYIKELA